MTTMQYLYHMGILVCSSRKTKGTKLVQDLSIPTDQRQAHDSSPFIFFRYFYWLDVNTFSKSILRQTNIQVSTVIINTLCKYIQLFQKLVMRTISTVLFLSPRRYFCWTFSPRGYHPLSSQCCGTYTVYQICLLFYYIYSSYYISLTSHYCSYSGLFLRIYCLFFYSCVYEL